MIAEARTRFESLKAGGMLPSPQGVALAVLELTQKHDASIGALTHLVQTDPAMSGRILRYANAVHGGSLRHIASLPHAIVFLGMFRIRQIALGFSLIDHYRSGACAGFDYLGYWTASLAAGITAQTVSAKAQCPPDESFTCGLLSGIGQLALATVFPNEYSAILQQNLTGLSLREAEIDNFGLDHAALSSELLLDWGLPEIFHEAVRYHELPAEAPFAAGSRVQMLTAVLHLSTKIGALLNLDAAQRWERVPSLYHAAAQIGLEDHQVPPLVENVVNQWQDWGRELHLPTRDFSDIKLLLGMPPDPSQDNNHSTLVMQPMQVALITHDTTHLRVLADTLEAMGLTVNLATDRDSALYLLQENPPDLMMLQLPDSSDDAITLLRELRASNGGHQSYCIVMIPAAAENGVTKLMLAGASDYLLLGYSESALLARLTSAQRVVALQGAVRAERESVIRSSGDWARSNQRLLQEALTDALTKLPNRRYGLDRFAQEWTFSVHSGKPLSCMMLDVDHFKRINDQYGHDIGDRVLMQLARILEHSCRKNDIAFRFGGEEFCVVCPDTGLSDALQLGERIVREVRAARFGSEGKLFPATLSIGVAMRDASDSDQDALLGRADKAMYAAKSTGRDRVLAARS